MIQLFIYGLRIEERLLLQLVKNSLLCTLAQRYPGW